MGIFSIFNKKIRCPHCGCKNNHQKAPKDRDNNVDSMVRELMGRVPKDSLTHRMYEESLSDSSYCCSACAKVFSLSTATNWNKIAERHGEKIALEEYKDSSKS